MGNTCASFHIAWRGNADDAAKAVSRSYAKLGYERVKKAPADGGKHVIVTKHAQQAYVSVYDSANAQLDSGELKDLALAVSKTLGTAAVFTSLYDSDTYEFIVFANGRQIDLLMTDAESYDGPLKRLSDKARVAKWSSLFRPLSLEQIKQVTSTESVFADDLIAGLSRLIGLSDGQPQINYQDLADETDHIIAQFDFKKKPLRIVAVPESKIVLSPLFDPDDSYMLLIYPASWPMMVGGARSIQWLIVSEGGGFSGATATFRFAGTGQLGAGTGSIIGCKLHNGQVVGAL